MPPQLISRPPKKKFSQDNCSCKNNQFKPVLASAEFMKNLKFPTFNINFTHFFEFLKEFYIFRISGPPGSFWYQQLQDLSSINGEKYCPWEMVISIQFLLHSKLHDSPINMKTISCSTNTSCRNPVQSLH